MEVENTAILEELFLKWAGVDAEAVEALPKAGSDRRYFRLQGGDKSAIGALSPDHKENAAFLSFSKHFHQLGLPVPEIYATAQEAGAYLQEDLGSEALLTQLIRSRKNGGDHFPAEIRKIYERALEELARMQVVGGKGLDYSRCIPRDTFDKQAMLWDLNYFKYFFLKLSALPFDEQALEDDFHSLADWLLQTDTSHFMFRDFQARNIMVKDGKPYFIDYQGGRRGALQYDLASLLYQAKADLPHAARMDLIDHYLDALEQLVSVDRKSFKEHFFGYLLIRTLQVLGAYGFRGFVERRPHFLESIPFALNNLAWIRKNVSLPVALPTLEPLLDELPDSPKLAHLKKSWPEAKGLTVRVHSFSFKAGIPADPSGNGGGFVFDCRGLHNPGRYQPYKKQTGRDQPVIDFLLAKSRVSAFFEDAKATVSPTVERYLERGFSHLMIGFGCTGGQHRSVYCADRMAEYLEKQYGVNVVLEHIEQEKKNWIN